MNWKIKKIIQYALFLNVVCIAKPKPLTAFELKPEGLGPIKIGMTLKQASDNSGLKIIEDSALAEEKDSACSYAFVDKMHNDVAIMLENRYITRIEVHSKIIGSFGNIHIGDDEKLVKRFFTTNVMETPHPYDEEGKYLTVRANSKYYLVFETHNGKIESFRSGDTTSVQYIEGCL